MWKAHVVQKGEYGKEELEFLFEDGCDALNFVRTCLEAGVRHKTKVEITYEEEE
jgi:hypothetical protein